MAENAMADKNGAGEVAETYILIPKKWETGCGMGFWNSKIHPNDTFPPTRPNLPILPILSTVSLSGDLNIQIYESMGLFLFKPPQTWLCSDLDMGFLFVPGAWSFSMAHLLALTPYRVCSVYSHTYLNVVAPWMWTGLELGGQQLPRAP